MPSVAIPAWTSDGVLPPINPSRPVDPQRSPYVVSLTDYVLRFGDTSERRTIIEGFLRYRAALHAAGLLQGFQWLDGSFLEHIERIEGRAPRDIDVVTFYRLPPGVTQRQLATALGALLDPGFAKVTYHIDGYLVGLGMEPERLVEHSVYWYSVWAHRRSQLWKGFVQVDLTDAEDAAATATLASLASQGGAP
jgi:hypothetical protein